MRTSWMILVIAGLVLASCGSVRESRLNPVNWFGSSTSTNVSTVDAEEGTIVTEDGQVIEINPLIGERRQLKASNPRNRRSAGSGDFRLFGNNKEEGPYLGTLVDQVTELEIKRTSTGAIVSVTGVTSRQGAFDVRLVPRNAGVPINGTLTYELRALQPIETAQGPQTTRRIQAAAPLSAQDLELVRTVEVVARRNTRTSRR